MLPFFSFINCTFVAFAMDADVRSVARSLTSATAADIDYIITHTNGFPFASFHLAQPTQCAITTKYNLFR